MREISSIVGAPVISIAEGIELGKVQEVVIDLAEGVIMGMVVERNGVEEGIWSDDIAVIGPDAVMLDNQERVQPLTDMPTLVERRRSSLDRPVQVLTKSGMKVGMLADIFVDAGDRTVVRYEISGGPLRDLTDGTLSFATIEGMIHGRDIIVIPDETIARLPEQVGGLKGAWARLSETLREDYQDASVKAGELYKASSQRLKVAAESAKEKSQEVSKSIGEKLEDAREKVEERVHDLTDDHKETDEQDEDAEAPDVESSEPEQSCGESGEAAETTDAPEQAEDQADAEAEAAEADQQ